MSGDSNLEDSLFGLVLQDSYKITGLLGEGGMGAVYDALQIRLNKRVAIKVMARELASNTEALNRFHREAMITSGLGHPHIVQVFDFATTPSGQPFLAMEFLAGEDLDRRIARVGRLSPTQMIHIVKQVASALAATHAQEIVHRDLKPANIYLLNVAGEDDFVKVLDFGISKIRAANTKITKASALIGTPDYMSPEQAMGQGDDVDERTDQWALACIAWECLCGKGPFFGDNIPSMLFQVVHRDPPSLSAQVNDLPRGVEPVLRRALSKNKEERYLNVTEFAQALEAAVLGRVSVSIADNSGAKRSDAAYESLSPEERSERPTTTFSLAATEAETETIARPTRPKWQWAVAGVGATALSLTAILLLRPAPPSKPAATSLSAPAPAAEPVTPPPVAPAAPTAATAPTVVPAPAPTTPEPAAAAPVAAPVADKAKTEGDEPAPDAKPATPAEGKRRVRKSSSVRQPGKAAVPPSALPKTERRLIKEL